MASDTATLDLERVHEHRRQQEAERDRQGTGRVELGPEDRAPDDSGPIDIDPATRAHLIVQEVLASAHTSEPDPSSFDAPLTDDSAAGRARRIVEEILTAADAAQPVASADVVARPTQTVSRADLVLLGVPQPLVLIPGPAFDPDGDVYVPASATTLEGAVDRALGSLTVDDEDQASQDLRAAIRAAAESSAMPGMRWIVAGTVWALAFALIVPLAVKGMFMSVDMTVDLWGDGPDTTAVTEVASTQP